MKKYSLISSPVYCTVVISVGLQVGILYGTLEGAIKCPIYIVEMTAALPCGDGTDPAFVCKPVFGDDGRLQWRRRWDGADGSDKMPSLPQPLTAAADDDDRHRRP